METFLTDAPTLPAFAAAVLPSLTGLEAFAKRFTGEAGGFCVMPSPLSALLFTSEPAGVSVSVVAAGTDASAAAPFPFGGAVVLFVPGSGLVSAKATGGSLKVSRSLGC